METPFLYGEREWTIECIGAPHATDQDILDRVDDITALMLGALGRAMAERRATWLLHYSWFVDLINELLDDLPSKPLDG